MSAWMREAFSAELKVLSSLILTIISRSLDWELLLNSAMLIR